MGNRGQLTAANTPCTEVLSVPYEITLEGVYCFTSNLETSMPSGNAITISANNVTINMNGWKLDGLSAGTTTNTIDIYTIHKNVTIRYGTIQGFEVGIYSNSLALENLIIEGTRAIKNIRFGFSISGQNVIIRHNQVINPGGVIDSQAAIGIQVAGASARVLNNDIINTTVIGSNNSKGMSLLAANGAVIENNRIDVVSTESGTGGRNSIF